MRCFKCGTDNVDNAAFCGKCGSPLVNNQQPVYINNQKQGLTTGQKVLIIILLSILLGISILFLLLFGKNRPTNNYNRPNDETKTIMIYMVGSNLESEAMIATSELKAMEDAGIDVNKTNVLVYTGGTTKWHNFVSNNENAIYKLTSNGFEKIEAYQKKNMGDASTLSSFLEYTYNNYKTSKYYLIFFDHGGAIEGAIYDDFTNDNLSLADFGKALSTSPFNSKNKIDGVLFRTCLNGTLEVASVFDDYAKYIIFSEEITLGSSKSNVLGYFIGDANNKSDPIDVGNAFIDAYNKQMSEIDRFNSQTITYSLIDLSGIKDVINKLDDYIKTLDVKKYYKEISTVRNRLYQYGSTEVAYDMIDLKEFILQTRDYATGNPDELLNAIDKVVIRNNTNLNSSHGLSVYMPYKGSQLAINAFTSVFDKLDFSSNYSMFIREFAANKQNNVAFTYSFSGNKFQQSSNEVKLELTPEQKDTITSAFYYVFRGLEGDFKDYYRLVYASNNATIDNGVVSTHMNGRFIKISDEPGQEELAGVRDIVYDSIVKRTIPAIVYDKDKQVVEKNFMLSSNLIVDDDNGTPRIGNMEVISRDDRIQGVIYDIDEFETLEIMFSSFNIRDKDGKIAPTYDWTTPKTHYGMSYDLSKVKVENTSLDNEHDYYVLFVLYDYNDNAYYSDLIKVGE